MKKAIAMRCTQEQFEAIKPKIEKENGFEIVIYQSFDIFPYLTNPFKEISSIVRNYRIPDHEREIHETWNEKIFLEACGIKFEKPIRTNKLTELEKRVEVLDNKVDLKKIDDMPEKPLIRDKKSSYRTFKDAIEANKIILPKLSDTINVIEELKNYKPLSFGLDFDNGKSIFYESGFRHLSDAFGIFSQYEIIKQENTKLKSRIEKLEEENKAILAGNLIEFKKGDWITLIHDTKTIICITDLNESLAYGINNLGYWCKETDNNGWSFNYKKKYWRLATESEVFESLENEIKKRYKVGEYFKSLHSSWTFVKMFNELYLDFKDFNSNSIIYHQGYVIYEKGKFAQIVDVLSKSEAEKQLGKKIID